MGSDIAWAPVSPRLLPPEAVPDPEGADFAAFVDSAPVLVVALPPELLVAVPWLGPDAAGLASSPGQPPHRALSWVGAYTWGSPLPALS